MKKNLLIISNGKGEDSIAITILNQFKKVLIEEGIHSEEVVISALPLVDNGTGYKKNGFNTVATWDTMPSKGFNILNIFNLFKDLTNGLFHILKKQIQLVKKESASADLIVTVGDILPLLLASFWGNQKPIVHIGTAMSAYIRNYFLLEIWLLKRFSVCTVCRDELTAASLRKFGVPAIFYGNPMMDDPVLKKTNISLNLEKNKKNIVLIPSSREDAYSNICRMLKIVTLLGKKGQLQFLLSLSPNLNENLLNKTVNKIGWKYVPESSPKPVVAQLVNSEANPVHVIKGYFRECLEDATLVFGMTGTGNEQIVGLGIPVVLFSGQSAAASRSRMHHYKRLLGEAVFIPTGKDENIALQILTLLRNTRQLSLMAEVGRTRMGKPGGAYSIARKLYSLLIQPAQTIKNV